MIKYAPIVLFVYERYDHLLKTVHHLQRNTLTGKSKLFVYSDGPRDDQQSKSRVARVRQYLRSLTGFRTVTIIESETNKGLANSVIDGVTAIVNKYGKVIVLEDDLEVSPDFLQFMNEALDVYVDEPKVMQISGHMFDVQFKNKKNILFLPFITSWGWGTWKRAWDCFDESMSNYSKISEDKQLQDRFNLDGAYDYFGMLQKQLNGKIDSWAIRWYLSVFFRNGLTLYPVSSLIRNIGHDASGTHCGFSNCIENNRHLLLPDREKIHLEHIFVDNDSYMSVKNFLLVGNCSRRVGIKRLSLDKFLKIIRNYWCLWL